MYDREQECQEVYGKEKVEVSMGEVEEEEKRRRCLFVSC